MPSGLQLDRNKVLVCMFYGVFYSIVECETNLRAHQRGDPTFPTSSAYSVQPRITFHTKPPTTSSDKLIEYIFINE